MAGNRFAYPQCRPSRRRPNNEFSATTRRDCTTCNNRWVESMRGKAIRSPRPFRLARAGGQEERVPDTENDPMHKVKNTGIHRRHLPITVKFLSHSLSISFSVSVSVLIPIRRQTKVIVGLSTLNSRVSPLMDRPGARLLHQKRPRSAARPDPPFESGHRRSARRRIADGLRRRQHGVGRGLQWRRAETHRRHVEPAEPMN